MGGGVVRKIESVVLLILALVNVDCQSRFQIGQGSRLSDPRFKAIGKLDALNRQAGPTSGVDRVELARLPAEIS
jgi:hypothetical protein